MANIVHGEAVIVAVDFTNKAGKEVKGWALPGGEITSDIRVAESTARRIYKLIMRRG